MSDHEDPSPELKLSEEQLQLLITSARGRKQGSQAPCAFVRFLTGADMDLLLNPPPLGSTPPMVKRLRSQHHHLARLLATGIKDVEAAMATGYSQSRVSILKQDPAFAELITYYKAQADQTFVDIHEKLAGLGGAVVEELQERMEQDPDALSVSQLLAMGEFALDRSVAPPKTKASTPAGTTPAIRISFHSAAELPKETLLQIEGTSEEISLDELP